jgi:formylglycine-generating enzyme required for sulfatase activity
MPDTFASLDKQIAEIEANLRLISERKAEFPEQQFIPLDLIKNERRLQEQLADLQARRARLQEAERQRTEEETRSTPRPLRRRVLLCVALAVVLLLAIGTIGWFYRQWLIAGQAPQARETTQAAAQESQNIRQAEARASETPAASAEPTQQQLAQPEGERLLQVARQLKGSCDVQGAMAKFAAAVQADPGLELDLKVEEADVRRQCATKLVHEAEQLAAAGRGQEAAAKLKEALGLDPPEDTPVYVRVPAGEFTMGSAENDTGALDNEKPQRTVPVDEFWIARIEVTNAQYLRCIDAEDHPCTAPNNHIYDKLESAKLPVTDVTWEQANAYARWVGGRLPTEAEWEKACRGTDARSYPWGNELPTDKLANFNDPTGSVTAVGSYPLGKSPYGLLDMAGNVWEWTSSAPGDYGYIGSDGSESPDPSSRVQRGGAYYDIAANVRCAVRIWSRTGYGYKGFGFRVVVSPVN